MLNYLYLILILGYVFLTIGLILKEKLYVALMGMVLLFAGLAVVTDGLGGVKSNLTETFGVITTIVGTVFFLKYGAEELEKIKI
jgi:uncharacterized membrane protein